MNTWFDLRESGRAIGRLARLRASSGFRLALLYTTVFILSSTMLFGVVHWATVGALRQQISDAVDADVTAMLRVGRQDGELTANHLAQTLTEGRGAEALHPGLRYAVVDAAGRRLAGNMERLPSTAVSGSFEIGGEEEDGEEALLGGVVTLPGGALVVARDAARLDETADLVENAFLWAGGVMLVLGLGGGLLVAHGFLRRVDAIAATAEAIAHGELDHRVPIWGATPTDEMDRLGAAINAMLDRIRDLMEELRHANSAIAHDLRTPLARLRQGLDAARARATTSAEYETAVDAAISETDAILRSFAALLRIAQVEAGARRSAFAFVNLSELASELSDAYGPSAEDSGRTLTTRIDPDVVVRGDRELLMQALANLLENVLRHTPQGTRIVVQVARTGMGEWPTLAVEDDGPGIPPVARAQVLRRFHRLDPSRSDGGNGLGLALVAAVATLHEAELSLSDGASERGLRVALHFRLNEGVQR
ncbi:HAMP domain-containing histidine kinase [Dankookia rubra]|uniref:histidine kinase n=1 Tax=Dankookia rubra TaxID=1442381 RepID=A0A4R5QBR4_9PROT|nr:HAMP domain-containing sensor histidine kinase [Dankookia rubra]TDH59717.1 HAMP domain-containing histidine kinase [Dankookia rubra]